MSWDILMQLDLDVGETGMRIWLLFGLVVPNVAWGATFNVCPSCTYKTIQDAIDDASSGDTINVASGSYSGGVLLDRDVDLIGTSGSASTTIRHTGQAVEVLSGVTSTIQGFTIDSTGSRAMTVNGGTVILDDIVVSGVSGHDLNGSALNVRNGATVTATDLDYSNNDAGSSLGGHIYCSDSTLTASNSTLSDGEASEQGGGLYADNCTVTLSNVDFDAHVVSEPTSVHAMGAGIYVNDSTLSVSDSLYSGNDSEEDGGAIAAENSTVTIDNTLFNGNSAYDDGGALYIRISTLTITNSEFTSNIAESTYPSSTSNPVSGGGGIWSTATDVSVSDTLFDSNVAQNSDGDGGGMMILSGMLTVTDSTFTSNEADLTSGWGGGIYTQYDDLELTNVDMDSNQAYSGAGLFAVNPATTTITGGTWQYNDASFAGAIFMYGNGGEATFAVDIEGVSFDQNQSTQTGAGEGGAIYLATYASTFGSALITDNTFSNNWARYHGGAVRAYQLGKIAFTGNDFTSNFANFGGALSVRLLEGLDAKNNLFCTNTAGASGGAVFGHDVGDTAGSTWVNNFFVENEATSRGGGVFTDAVEYQEFTNNHFLGNDSGDGGAFYANDENFSLVNNLFAFTQGGDGVSVASTPSGHTIDYNDFYLNTSSDLNSLITSSGSNNLTVDPELQDYTLDGNCTNDDYRLAFGSGLIDKGDPSLFDPAPDSSRSDIGAYGGPGADADEFADSDSDGVIAMWDCDELDSSIYPGADEYCNSVDDDCDGTVDEDDAVDASTWYLDFDGDGYGESTSTTAACSEPSGYTDDDSDCDDTLASINPGADEYCNGVDDDCDGDTDEDDAVDVSTWYRDNDGDGFGDSTVTDVDCSEPSGYTDDNTDCDDTSNSIYPGADEYCNGTDDDCDGTTDEDSAVDVSTWYQDSDGDGFGNASATDLACDEPSGYTSDDTDCNDSDGEIYPGADEYCNGVDDDCDDSTDESDAVDVATWYEDSDGDGFGNAAVATEACDEPSDYTDDDSDCDDESNQIYPGAEEIAYDGIDQDCDGTDLVDVDGDGYAAEIVGGDDCDDEDADINPGAEDLPGDEIDSNCDGVDGGDFDGDGVTGVEYGGEDCDDDDASIYPGAEEVWYDGVDQDCDGNDLDQDGDGYDSSAFGGDDCDDENDGVNPGARDFDGDGADANCDGFVEVSSAGVNQGCGCSGVSTRNWGGLSWLMVGLVGLVVRRRSGVLRTR